VASVQLALGLPLLLIQPSRSDDAQRRQLLAAFATVARVALSPRCHNCYTSVDYPRQGDDRLRHLFHVTRGSSDMGASALPCSTYHGSANNSASGMPGVDDQWRLAPLAMGWDGLSAPGLCRQLTGPRHNGKSQWRCHCRPSEDAVRRLGVGGGDGSGGTTASRSSLPRPGPARLVRDKMASEGGVPIKGLLLAHGGVAKQQTSGSNSKEPPNYLLCEGGRASNQHLQARLPSKFTFALDRRVEIERFLKGRQGYETAPEWFDARNVLAFLLRRHVERYMDRKVSSPTIPRVAWPSTTPWDSSRVSKIKKSF
jgi:hypothetical protein